MTVRPADIETEAHRYLGLPYGYRDRCGQGWDLPDGRYHELDCSGLVCKVLNRLGLTVGCTTSFVFAQLAFDHGQVIPKERALDYPCLLIEGPNQGRGPSQRANGSDGHIVMGFRTYTIEERGHAYGCVTVAPIDLARFDIAAWFPGVDYTPPPSPIFLEPTMIIQNNHFDEHGKPIPISTKDAQGHYRVARWSVAPDGKSLEGRGGASIFGDQPAAGCRRFTPPNLGAASVTAICRWDPKDGTVPGLFVQYSDGRGYPVRFS